MIRLILKQLVWVVGVVLMVVGLVLSAGTARVLDETRTDLQARNEHLRLLAALRDQLAPDAAAAAAYREACAGEPVSLDRLIQETMPSRAPDDKRESRRPVTPGWDAIEKEITFRDIHLGDVMPLVTLAAQKRPPWRLTKCIVRASSSTPGRGQVVLGFEALAAAAE